MPLIYLDSSAMIYAVEGVADLQRRVLEEVTREPGHVELAVSRLSMLECRVKPLRDKRSDVIGLYVSFFGRSDVALIEISERVIDSAAHLRADLGFKVPDAIHVASALAVNADRLLTGDQRMSRCPGLRIGLIVP